MYLTKRQREIYNFVQGYLKKEGFAPTLQEIADNVGIASLSTIHKHLKNMEIKGAIRRDWNRGRSIELISNKVQPQTVEIQVLGKISAGAPIEALEDREWIMIPREIARDSEMFVLRVKDDSLADEHILGGDHIILERRNTADDGERVLAIIEEWKATVKTFYQTPGGSIRLESSNTSAKPYTYPPDAVEVKGVVVGLIRKY